MKTTETKDVPVRALRRKLLCDCGGEYTRKGTKGMGVRCSMPAQYPHKCSDCSEVTWVRGKTYPYTVYEEIEELKLGTEGQLKFEVRRANEFYKKWKEIAEDLMEQQAMPDRDLDSRISNLYELEKEVAEGL